MADEELISGNRSTRFLITKEKFQYHNLRNINTKFMFGLRAVFVTLGLFSAVLNSFTAFTLPMNNIECIWDGLFALTSPLNEFFVSNSFLRHLLLIFSSSLIDFQYLFFCYNYLLWGNSIRPVLFLSIFYGFRSFVQNIFMIRYPEGSIWDYPGIPSLTVSYANTTDFYYSGHVGILVFTALESRKNKYYQMMWISLASVIIESFMMIVLRGHYTIDLIAGIIFGHYFWIFSNKSAKKIEKLYRNRIQLKE
jgi:PAP2 superfamily C-terminal